MVPKANIRCPHCRTPVPVEIVWATGDACPACWRPLGVEPSPERPPAAGDAPP